MSDMPNIDIRPDHWEIVRDILRKHVPQYEVWAFGSRVKWTAKTYSDLDLAVITDKPLSIQIGANLSEAFSDSDLPWKVDVVDWATTSESFKEVIERDKVVVQKGPSTSPRALTECVVGDIAASVRNALVGGPFGSDLVSGNYVAKGVPVIRGTNMGHGRWVGGDFVFVSKEKADSLAANCAVPGDIVFTQRGTLGQVALVPKHGADRYLISQSQMKLTVDAKKADAMFVYYVFTSQEQLEYIRTNAIQTGVPHTNLGILRNTPLKIPPLEEQKSIAGILGSLDDKIELCRRSNETLETMARALFKAWFVDFEPVRAKIDGRWRPGQSLPGLPAQLYHLFPDRLVESKMGEIPKGWEVATLGSICEGGGGNIQTGPFGTQLHASDYVPEGVPSIMPSDLRDNRIDTKSISRIREDDAERLSVYRVQLGDVVYSRRGDVERRSLIRRAEVGWLCGTGCLRVRFGPKGLDPYFGAAYLGSPDSRAWVVRHAVGATMPNLNTSILGSLPVVVPPAVLQAQYAEIVAPWDELGTNALAEAASLERTRDSLLPRLISGDLFTQMEVAE